jgi:predicted RecA/RadA family phage recombinase
MTAVAVPAYEEGRLVKVTAAAAQTRGDVVVVGQLIGIATKSVDNGATDQILDTEGIYDVDKNTSTAFSAGDRVYFDVADDELNDDATNPFLGIAVETVLAAATKVQVLLMPQRLADEEFTAAQALAAAKAGMFVSAVTQSTGSAQNVAHGLGIVPTKVLVAIQDNDFADSGTAIAYTITEGTHDATNVVLTVTAGVSFKVMAW